MNENDIKSLIACLIIVIIAIFLAFFGSQGGATVFGGIPLFTLAIIISFVIQWVAFIPAYIKQTEKYFDLTGSITYSTVIILSVLLAPALTIRSVLLLVLVLIWAIRLGTYLFLRIRKEGEDKRFTELKKSPSRFLLTWTLQGLWVSFTLAAALAAITVANEVQFSIIGLIGFLVRFSRLDNWFWI
jgi:steroid 5-alpha reductase family enzyme